MKLFLHIGMGKTGTSSIQTALTLGQEHLHVQKAHYLGMWFNFVDQKYADVPGFRSFLNSGAETVADGAEKFGAHIQDLNHNFGSETFIFSNEDLFGHVEFIAPLIETLATKVDVRIIMYVRDIQSWLPSAFAQWAIRHKTVPGKIPSFREMAPRLVQAYRAIDVWDEKFGPMITYRKFDKAVDVLADFASVVGLDIPQPKERELERSEDAELILRALYNNRFQTEVFPDRFNRFIFDPGRQAAPKLAEVVRNYFDYSCADEAIATEMESFKAVGEKIGVDFTSGVSKSMAPVDMDALRNRLLEYLIEITMEQAQHFQRIEKRLKDLEARV